jgi:hypothetical protein
MIVVWWSNSNSLNALPWFFGGRFVFHNYDNHFFLYVGQLEKTINLWSPKMLFQETLFYAGTKGA